MQGLKHLVDNPSHRKEIVAGNLGEYVTTRMLIHLVKQPHLDASRDQNSVNRPNTSVTMRVSSQNCVEPILSRIV